VRTLVFAVSLTVTLAGVAAEAHAMRCGNRLVDRGDSAARVQRLCGEPTQVTRRLVERERAVHRRGPGGVVISERVTVTVEVQEWVYDRGPRRLVRVLTFEDGELVALATGGYGVAE
jgi:hypothetical protein